MNRLTTATAAMTVLLIQVILILIQSPAVTMDIRPTLQITIQTFMNCIPHLGMKGKRTMKKVNTSQAPGAITAALLVIVVILRQAEAHHLK